MVAKSNVLEFTIHLLKKLIYNFFTLVKNNKAVSMLILLYLSIMTTQLDWGIPNSNHPFSYHMDEWAQAQALRSTFKQGTPHVPGAGNGTVFFYLVSGFMLLPFVILHIVNPFIIKSSLLYMQEQHRLFEVLRLQSIFYATLSIIVVSYIARRFFKASSFLAACFFTITPVFVMLTIFYRYDTPVVFWILLSLLFSFRFIETPTTKNFFILGIISALTVAIKVSAVPLFLTYIVSFFLFMPNWRKKFRLLLLGIIIFVAVFIAAGIPDAFISFKQFAHWVYISTISNSINATANYIFGMPFRIYFFFFAYPATFGRVFYITYVSCLISLTLLSLKHIFKRGLSKTNKKELFLIFSFVVFSLSIFFLGVGGSGNRLLVLLPFLGLISSIVLKKLTKLLNKNEKFILFSILTIGIIFQTVESLSWVSTRFYPDPRETSSGWIKKNIPKGSFIGIENIPIYQDIPDIILKDFYTKQYFPEFKTIYSYQVIDEKTRKFPPIIIITDDVSEQKLIKVSEKKKILAQLKIQGYKKAIAFSPNFSYLGLFNDDKNFYFSGLRATPFTITIFKKDEIQNNWYFFRNL